MGDEKYDDGNIYLRNSEADGVITKAVGYDADGNMVEVNLLDCLNVLNNNNKEIKIN